MNFYIHHPGKAGEVFMGLPMARLLKTYHPDSKITWVVLDLYRDSVGNYPYIDEVETIPSYSCSNLSDVSGHMSKHRYYACHSKRWVEDPYGIHIDAYYNYMLYRLENNRFRLHRDPFYIQLFKNAVHFCPDAHEVDSWLPPEWYPTEQAIIDSETFQKQYGGGPVIIFSPYVADKSCVSDNQSSFDMHFIYEQLRKWNLPVIATGTKWDAKDFPSWILDGYSPSLSLGGLFYLLQNRAALVVSPNSGIGFAAHWLGAPVVMIDNRTGWKDQVEVWRKKVQVLDDQAFPHENRWPPFLKDNFSTQHLSPAPFEQIEWSHDAFLQALTRMKPTTVNAHEALGKVSAAPKLQPAIIQPTDIQDRESQRTVCVPKLSTMIEKEELPPLELPRLVVFDTTRHGDGTATGELKATLFHGWPEHRFVQIYSTGQDLMGADGAVPRHIADRADLKLEDVSNLVREFAPDMLLYRPVPDNMGLHVAAMNTIRSSTRPLAVWIMDDWPSRLSAENPNLFVRLDADLRELLARADLRLSICDAMSKAFAERYNVPFKAFANAVDPNDWPDRKRENRQGNAFMLRYAGSLAENMTLDSVLRAAHAVELLGDNGVDIHFEIKTYRWWVQRAADRFNGLKRTSISTGNLSSDAYRSWLSEADALLIAYNFDAASRNYIRYSFANKLPECLASGAVLVAHGPKDVSTIEYINELGCAIVVSNDDKKELASAIEALILDPHRQRYLAEKARAIAFSAHNVYRVRHAFRSEFVRIANRKRIADTHVWFPEYERDSSAHVDETKIISVVFSATTDTERIMIDVGAHFGSSAQHFVRKGWKIYCFEPDAANRERLVAKFSDTPNVIIDPRAVSDKTETGKPFFSSPESTGISGLHAFRDTHKQSMLVDVTTVADIVEQYKLDRIDFLKIDVEGLDFAVLRGVPWNLIKPTVIECEFEDAKTIPLGHSYTDIADFLVGKGYVVYVSEWHPIIRYGIQHDWCRLFRYPGPLRDSQAWGNLLAFLEDPGIGAISDALSACVKIKSTQVLPRNEVLRPAQTSGTFTNDDEDTAVVNDVSPANVDVVESSRRFAFPSLSSLRMSFTTWSGVQCMDFATWVKTQSPAVFRLGRFVMWSLSTIGRHPLPLFALLFALAALSAAPAHPLLWRFRVFFWSAAGVLSLFGFGVFSAAMANIVLRRLDELQGARVEAQLFAVRRSSDGRITGLESKITALSKDLQAVAARQQQAEEASAALAHQLSSLTEAVRAVQAQTTTLAGQEDLQAVAARQQQAEEASAALAHQLSSLTEAVRAVQAQTTTLAGQIEFNPAFQRFSRTLNPTQIGTLRDVWSKRLGLRLTDPSLSYIAHRIRIIEQNATGRLATSIEDAVLRTLVSSSVKSDTLEVLEIGTLFGIGLAMIYDNNRGRYTRIHLTAIDPLTGYYRQNEPDVLLNIPISESIFWLNMERSGVPRDDVSLITELSTSNASIEKVGSECYDVLIIDGDHSYAGVKVDFSNYVEFIRRGGYIIFDDYGSTDWPDVKRFVDEEVLTDSRVTLVGTEWRTAVFRVVQKASHTPVPKEV